MQRLRRPVKMATSSKRAAPDPAAPRRYLQGLVFHGQARVRRAISHMAIRLPFEKLLVSTRQSTARITASRLSRYESAIVLLPSGAGAADFRVLPHGAVLREIYGRKIR